MRARWWTCTFHASGAHGLRFTERVVAAKVEQRKWEDTGANLRTDLRTDTRGIMSWRLGELVLKCLSAASRACLLSQHVCATASQ